MSGLNPLYLAGLSKVMLVPIFLLFAAHGFCGDQGLPFPVPEDCRPDKGYSNYLEKAAEFLARNPSSQYAPRVTFDVMLVAGQTANSGLSDEMKGNLLFDHPRSLQANFTVSLFKDAADFRRFVIQQGDVRMKTMPGRLPKQFVQVVAAGLQRFGKALLDDDAFLVRVHCFATAAMAGDLADLSGPLLNARRKPCGDFDELVGTHLERGADPVQKVLMFHKAEGDVADFFERFYLSRLSLSEEKRPEIVKIMAENAVSERDYEKALELISLRWRDFKDDPQIHYWKAWALFALGKDAPAIKQLEMMVSGCLDPQWAKSAGSYAGGMRRCAALQKDSAKDLLEVSQVLKKGVGVLEATAEFNPDANKLKNGPLSAYLGLVTDENRFEFLVYKGRELFLAYRSSLSNSAIYFSNEPKIMVFASPGPVPVPQIQLAQNDEGKLAFNAGFMLGTSIKEVVPKSSAFFDSPYVSTSEGALTLLEYLTRRKGAVPGKRIDENGTVSCQWLFPRTDSPAFSSVEYRLSADRRIVGIRTEDFALTSIKYGPKGAFQLNPPPWPERPVMNSRELDVAAIMRLMGVVFEAFASQQ